MVTNYAGLLPVCKVEKKDRHVLAAAIRGRASLIVTSNVRDFPNKAVSEWGIDVSHPGEYLISLYSMDSGLVVSRLNDIARRKNVEPQDVLIQLGRSVPSFASYVANELGW